MSRVLGGVKATAPEPSQCSESVCQRSRRRSKQGYKGKAFQVQTVVMQSFSDGLAKTLAASSRADSSLAAVLTGSK